MRLESCTCQMVRSVPKSTRTCTCTCDIYELEYLSEYFMGYSVLGMHLEANKA